MTRFTSSAVKKCLATSSITPLWAARGASEMLHASMLPSVPTLLSSVVSAQIAPFSSPASMRIPSFPTAKV